jgi:signal peptidase II
MLGLTISPTTFSVESKPFRILPSTARGTEKHADYQFWTNVPAFPRLFGTDLDRVALGQLHCQGTVNPIPEDPLIPMSNRWVFLSVVALGVVADLWTKAAVFARWSLRDQHEVIPGFFFIAPVENPGAVWSLFQTVTPMSWVILRGAISLALIVFYFKQKHLPTLVRLAFAFVIAGALGNLHDNALTDHGKVRDFIRWVFFGWAFPTFNIADSMISVGACTLAVYYMFIEPRQQPATKQVLEASKKP